MIAATELTYRPAHPKDGANLWKLIGDIGTLERNSSYCYLMMARMFSDTCVVAEFHGRPVGLVVGFCPPGRRDTAFVWQVGVHPDFRGAGLATGLLTQLLEQTGAAYLEATVGVSNASSRALFTGFGRRAGAACRIDPYFTEADFPESHEAEQLYRLGPVERRSPAYRELLARCRPEA